jgi:hypothetical protein
MMQGFLSRWSRRKQAAAQAAEAAKVVETPKSPPHPDTAAAQEYAASAGDPEFRDTSAAPSNSPDPGVPAFDPASLPAIEAISAETDIRAFFAAGVPAELTRAALRRAWVCDPKIRDFVGLADYDWDFNTPGAMAGFGPLEGADALRAQFARRFDPAAADSGAAESGAPETRDQGPVAQRDARGSAASGHDGRDQPTKIMTEDEPSQRIEASPSPDEPGPDCKKNAAVQQREEKSEVIQSIARRRHGAALPES